MYGRCYAKVWQMECHCGRCYGHLYWLTDVMLRVADGIANGIRMVYVNLSSGVLIRTSFYMHGRWYLPMFLLRDGLLTLLYNDSFIVLVRFLSSLPTMLKLSTVVVWPVMLQCSYREEEALRCSLNLSPNVPEDSPIYFSSQSTL